jgi:uncharacterized membrane protein YkoI
MWMAAVVLALASAAAPSDKPGHQPRRSLEKMEPRAGASKTTLARAIVIALREVPGEALDASIELEDGKAVVEVTVYAGGRLLDVEIDGETGRVLDVEEEEDEEPLRGQSA